MSTMQVFYLDLTQTIALGGEKTETPVKKKEATTAGPLVTYHEKLAQLTRLTLAELNSNRKELGWSAWW